MAKQRCRALQARSGGCGGPTKLYLLERGRNAWRSTHVETDFRFGSLRMAQAAAEDMRKQGSTWNIQELPCLGIVSLNNTTLLITELECLCPLEASGFKCAPCPTVFEVARFFLEMQPKRHFRCYLAPSIEVDLGASPCYIHFSEPGGAWLAWKRLPSGGYFNGVLEAIGAFAAVPDK